MSRQGARISLAPVILAVVFPAIIGAAVALAYYGYRYAVAASVRSKASLMEGNQQLANLLTEQVQDRIDKADGELFDADRMGRHRRRSARARRSAAGDRRRWRCSTRR